MEWLINCFLTPFSIIHRVFQVMRFSRYICLLHCYLYHLNPSLSNEGRAYVCLFSRLFFSYNEDMMMMLACSPLPNRYGNWLSTANKLSLPVPEQLLFGITFLLIGKIVGLYKNLQYIVRLKLDARFR